MHTYVVVPSRFNQTANINWGHLNVWCPNYRGSSPNRVTAVPQANSASTFLPSIPGYAKRMLTWVLTNCSAVSHWAPSPPPHVFFVLPVCCNSRSLLWVILQVFKARVLGHDAPNWVQDSERWQERWKKNYWHFLQPCFTLCSEVPGNTTYARVSLTKSHESSHFSHSANQQDAFIIPASPPPPP